VVTKSKGEIQVLKDERRRCSVEGGEEILTLLVGYWSVGSLFWRRSRRTGLLVIILFIITSVKTKVV